LYKAAKRAGSKGKDMRSLSSIGYDLLKSLELSMPELLDAQGLTNEYANKVLADGLEAKHTVVATYQGKIGQEKTYEDRPTQAKYLEIFHRLRGNFVDRHELTGKDGGDISISYAPSKVDKKDKGVSGVSLDLN
jgi:hypothetical protein